MSNPTPTTVVKEQEVECNHKPGDVWADGCCTSKKNKKEAAAEGGASDLESHANEQSSESAES
ncbi:MAG: hypothetical protein AAFV85_27660 [Cyanobacteria bacterium J06634_6]